MLNNHFQILLNRLITENAVTPEFIGEFDDEDSLPKPSSDLPPIYWWINHSMNSSASLSLNTTLLKRWCAEELTLAGITFTEADLTVAIAMLNKFSVETFQNTFEIVLNQTQHPPKSKLYHFARKLGKLFSSK